MTDTTTIKIHEADRQRLKLLAVKANMTMMDYLSQLLDQQETQAMSNQGNDPENVPPYEPTKKNIAAVRRWWKAGKNIWEISQLTDLSTGEVAYIVNQYT